MASIRSLLKLFRIDENCLRKFSPLQDVPLLGGFCYYRARLKKAIAEGVQNHAASAAI
jgi:hypothetical protein